ncbi:CBU_0592 family membrane protein [Nocardioides bruguierae]|uniref:CBU-0592-like domain-containing protein n=1 Tax=Nocardioides bruguierae TaxID=2945102 RepID=A0A9X2D8U0_9ACTN|nr:hypothetical protein [Nocardioides bruguierae]MCM0621169.1 hypothetical protein [Nocardioides bruguierae]
MSLIDVAGWTGGVIVLVPYVLVALGRMSSSSHTYQWLNVVGGLLLMGTALNAHAMPNVAINVVWIGAGILTLVAAAVRGARAHRGTELQAVPAEQLPALPPQPNRHEDDLCDTLVMEAVA